MTVETIETVTMVRTAILNDYHQAGQEQNQFAEDYYAHLINDGEPREARMVGGYLTASLRSDYANRIYRAWEQEHGRTPTIFAPYEVGPYTWRLANRLQRANGMWITYADLMTDFPRVSRIVLDSQNGFGYQYNKLRDTGYRLERGKIGGAVAYRLVKDEAP